MVARELVTRFPQMVQESLFPDGVELEKNIGMHGGVSQVALEGVGTSIPEIAGMHHGSSPDSQFLLPGDALLGGSRWQKVREELITHLREFFHCDWPSLSSSAQATVVAGLTTVSDWIGSGTVFEQLLPDSSIDYDEMVKVAVDRAGFIAPQLRKGLSFTSVFPTYSPRPIQEALYESVQGPGVYILEALMGSGKTEAALYASYRLMEAGLANGIYFALPTRITSEKVYERMERFLDAILLPEDRHRALLAHGSAWLSESDMGEDARPGHAWFDSRKRKLLSPFAVGTIDQALMAVMNVRHGFVRAFGLAGKVVILDEVHTYDAYTGSILDNLIKVLRELGAIVILLSATLTAERKRLFLATGNQATDTHFLSQYPLVSTSIAGFPVKHSPPIGEPQYEVHISFIQDKDFLVETIREKALSGQYILWIENSVREAQDAFKAFASWGSIHDVPVGLIHSRFPTIRRNELESDWVEAYGKQGLPKRAKGGRILVGTQVLEQSLDIDADLLVTRIAPTDMVIQRIGRLWRHREVDGLRPVEARRQVFIIAPPMEKALHDPLWAFGPSGKIYAPYVLARSLLVLQEVETVTIPYDMRDLIEKTYREHAEESLPMGRARHELVKHRDVLQSFANNSMSMIGRAASDTISTRYSDIASCDVLLLLEGSDLRGGVLRFIDGETVQLPSSQSMGLHLKRQFAKACMIRVISVPSYLAPDPVGIQELSRLRPFLYISDVEEERLRIGILHQSGVIGGVSGRDANKFYDLEYSDVLGYKTTKKEGL
jgi:CRISPR-associated endonuclease/helicase Cas3